MPTLEVVLEQARQLSPLDIVRLIERVTPEIEGALLSARAKPFRSLWGSCRDLGPAPSAADIDQARKEHWADFPRDDVG